MHAAKLTAVRLLSRALDRDDGRPLKRSRGVLRDAQHEVSERRCQPLERGARTRRLSASATKWLAVVLAAAALPAVPAFARPPASQRTAAAVMRIEHEWLAALHRRDVRTLARILGREFVDSDFRGGVITRAQYLAYFARPVARPMRRPRQSFEDASVRFVAGDDVAIVTGLVITHATPMPGTPSGQPATERSRFTDVFVWRGARWQAVSGQETHFR